MDWLEGCETLMVFGDLIELCSRLNTFTSFHSNHTHLPPHQSEADYSLGENGSHIANIGRMVEVGL